MHKAKKSLGLKPRFARAKKALGQNFLKSAAALRTIIETGEIKSDDVVLEIGPGKGILTEKLLEQAGLVIAVEKDRELFEFLQEKFMQEIKNKKLILVNEDILEFEIESYKVKSYKIIANIPYNITGAILKKFLTAEKQPVLMVLMVQLEVAQRIIGRYSPSTPLRVKQSILSISVKAYGEPKMIMKVPARYFSPAPKVDSAIISIKNISREFFKKNKIEEEKFWEIVKKGFAHKRKKLSSNLKNASPDLSLAQLGNKRAEDLALEDWILIMELKKIQHPA
jgi:16S rRNA (adenine1518-N6/adenine1519-N6)-dimethyltransferase